MNPGTILETAGAARQAIRAAPAIFVQVMMGSVEWSVKVTKIEARQLIKTFETDWKTLEAADITALGVVESDGVVHLGGR